jgi:hypothetical protein
VGSDPDASRSPQHGSDLSIVGDVVVMPTK